jgi:putative phosphoribosyl transferase
VAASLRAAGLGTLLIDLLEPDEADSRACVFDIPLLAHRLLATVDWLVEQPSAARLPVGLFGASTGAGAALEAAARRPDAIAAVVSRGGRPDLAWEALPSVQCPTLLIVGGEDREVLALNRRAQSQLTCRSELVVIPGSTHLFPEPGALEQVAQLAADWFLTSFPRP